MSGNKPRKFQDTPKIRSQRNGGLSNTGYSKEKEQNELYSNRGQRSEMTQGNREPFKPKLQRCQDLLSQRQNVNPSEQRSDEGQVSKLSLTIKIL